MENYSQYSRYSVYRVAVPLIATTIAVYLLKDAAIAGGILLIKWIISKFKNK